MRRTWHLDKERLFPEYLAWLLRSEECTRYFDGERRGTYVQIIQRAALADLDIPLPTCETQRRIVEGARLAQEERWLSGSLARLKGRLVEEKLLQAARSSAKLS